MKRYLVAACVLLCCSAYGKEVAVTVRPTELKNEPYSDAQTLARLAERARVEVLGRQVSWLQVRSEQLTGWVKLLSLRFEFSGAPAKGESNALRSLFNLVTTGSSGSTVTTGARGLDESKLRTPSPNPQAFLNMQRYAVSEQEARQFAAQENLSTQELSYLNPGERK